MYNIENNVFVRELNFIQNIHRNTYEKLIQLSNLISRKTVYGLSYDDVKLVTLAIMRKCKRSDQNFLLWLHFAGCYIKNTFNARWILVHRQVDSIHYYVPFMMDEKEEIWDVGDFCYIYYYLKNRMKGISFELFYKLEIERTLQNNKFDDLNIPRADLIYLE